VFVVAEPFHSGSCRLLRAAIDRNASASIEKVPGYLEANTTTRARNQDAFILEIQIIPLTISS
jgi:hypothetical protein